MMFRLLGFSLSYISTNRNRIAGTTWTPCPRSVPPPRPVTLPALLGTGWLCLEDPTFLAQGIWLRYLIFFLHCNLLKVGLVNGGNINLVLKCNLLKDWFKKNIFWHVLLFYRNNEVWEFNFIDLTWQRKHTSNKRPNPRYGQTQVA